MLQVIFFEYHEQDNNWRKVRSFQITVEKFVTTKKRQQVDRFYKYEVSGNGYNETILTSHPSLFD